MMITLAEPDVALVIGGLLQGDIDPNQPHYQVRSRTEVTQLAEGLGCELIERGPTEVFLDLDQSKFLDGEKGPLTTFRARYFDDILTEIYPERDVKAAWFSRNKNYHVVIDLGVPVDTLTANSVAQFLGSDPRRALLTLWNLKEGAEVVDALFKPKETKDLTYRILAGKIEEESGSNQLEFFPTL